MEKITTTFVVSESPDRIEPAGEEVVSEYPTPEAAGEAIKKDHHGDFGTRYVLRVAFTPVAEYRRPWTLVRKLTGDEDDGHA